MFIMTTDVMFVVSVIMMYTLAIGYCVMKLCLSLINASKRIPLVQTTEMGEGEQMLVQTTRELRSNSIGIPPIYIPRNAYVERRVTKSFQKVAFYQLYL